VTGVYSSAFDERNPSYSEAVKRIKAFAELEGRKPKVMIAKMGQDGHDRGQKVVATAFKDIGFDVVIGPLFQTPEESAKMGIENDVDVIAASSLAAGHLNLVPNLRDQLKAQGRDDIMIIVGGVVPPEDVETLKEMGAKAVFPPGTNIPEAVLEVLVNSLAWHFLESRNALIQLDTGDFGTRINIELRLDVFFLIHSPRFDTCHTRAAEIIGKHLRPTCRTELFA